MPLSSCITDWICSSSKGHVAASRIWWSGVKLPLTNKCSLLWTQTHFQLSLLLLCSFCLFGFWDKVSCCPDRPQNHCLAKAGLELLMLATPRYWGYSCTPPHSPSVFSSSMRISRSITVEACGEDVLGFMSNYQAIFQSVWTVLLSHQQWVRVPVASHPHKHLVLSVARLLTLLTGI